MRRDGDPRKTFLGGKRLMICESSNGYYDVVDLRQPWHVELLLSTRSYTFALTLAQNILSRAGWQRADSTSRYDVLATNQSSNVIHLLSPSSC